MAVLAKMLAADMDADAYDRVSAYPLQLLKKQPGFLMHASYPGPAGFYVEEIWESQDLFEAWLDENVRPNVPDVQHEVIELHAVVWP